MRTLYFFINNTLFYGMKIKFILILLFSFVFFFPKAASSQIENVIVETYYISNQQDATDTSGGGLEAGSTTYRIYIDLAPGIKIKKIYGDQNHPLVFSSTENFFNNKADGQSFAKDFSITRLQENTVALDSWLTLGQTTRVQSSTNFGVLKINDTNGSFVGGVNNDGGSEGIVGGLITNNDSQAGIPLTISDGNDVDTIIPQSWSSVGIKNIISGEDSTIFGSIIPGNQFESTNAYLSNSGVMGIDSNLNHVLVAQLTTKGELSFEINLELEVQTTNGPVIKKFVAKQSLADQTEQLSPFLIYPQLCGCKDANYLEYSPSFGCGIQDSCKTPIILGCMDPMACNYNSLANFNIQETCCYIGLCNDLDLSLACPMLAVEELNGPKEHLRIYPNPTKSIINIQSDFISTSHYKIEIYDIYGKIVASYPNSDLLPSGIFTIDVSNLANGIYNISFVSSNQYFSGRVIKN